MEHRTRQVTVAQLFKDVSNWAADCHDILGVAVCGSYARGSADADSDVDIITLCKDLPNRLSNRGWLDTFGTVVSVEQEDYGLIQSLRTKYDTGLEVEFGLCESVWATPPIDKETATVILSGLIILYDPDDLVSAAQYWANENREIS